MSKKRARTSSPGDESTPLILAADYNGRTIAIPRNPNYQIVLSSRFEGVDQLVEIPAEMWAELVPKLTLVQVTLDDAPLALEETVPALEPDNTSKATVTKILHRQEFGPNIQAQVGIPPEDQMFFLQGDRLVASNSFASEGIEDGDIIVIRGRLRGGKLVIYLFPPADVQGVCVDLFLCKSWTFSDVYPPTPIQPGDLATPGEKVTWVVDAKPDGTLHDYNTEREVTYLFWEAHTEPRGPMSPACSRSSTPCQALTLEFDPSHAVVESNNSALLPFDKVTGYIDDALIALGLHTEARTSFITYWLPKLSQHKSIALRFLPQAAYEAAARLDITPAPDVTTRVFMLFKGVDESAIDLWKIAQVRAEESANIWPEIVGVDLGKATDATLFRALEWGGMEVY